MKRKHGIHLIAEPIQRKNHTSNMDSIELELLKIEKGHLDTDYKIYLHIIELERNALINKLAEYFQILGVLSFF